MAPATKVSENELGHVASWAAFSGIKGWGTDEAEETPALVWPESIKTLGRMARTDAQVRGTYNAVTLPLRRDIYALDPQDADPVKVDRLADDLDLPVKGQTDRIPRQRRRGRFSWAQHNTTLLLSLLYGHYGFEKVYTVGDDGMVRLRKLGPRPPATIANIDVAPDGGLNFIEQWPLGSMNTGIGKTVKIPVDRLIWHVTDKEAGNWFGVSILRSAYRNWLLKDRDMRVWSMSLERTGMGMPIITAGPDTTPDQMKELHAMAQAYRAGEGAGGALPYGAVLKLVGVEGSTPDHLGAINYHDAQIARSMLAQFLQLGTTQGQSGNRALGSVFLDFFTLALDAIAGSVADTTQQHLVEDLWDLNYGDSEPCPRLVARSIDTERDVPPEVIADLVKSGALSMDDALEEWLRMHYGMPVRTTARPEMVGSPTLDTPPPSPTAADEAPVAAAHRSHRGTVLAAVEGENEIRSALGGLVDVEAILAARAAGETIANAVEAGLPNPGPLHSTLLGLTTRAYSEGTAEATAKLPKTGFRSSPAPTRLIEVMDELGTRAAGMLDTLKSRLSAVLAGGEAQGLTTSALTDLLTDVGDNIENARLIAVTETRRAVMAAAFDVYAANGIVETEWVRTSGSKHEDICATRNGEIANWSTDPPPLHPRCGCMCVPPGTA